MTLKISLFYNVTPLIFTEFCGYFGIMYSLHMLEGRAKPFFVPGDGGSQFF
jgi:hypothetical protein